MDLAPTSPLERARLARIAHLVRASPWPMAFFRNNGATLQLNKAWRQLFAEHCQHAAAERRATRSHLLHLARQGIAQVRRSGRSQHLYAAAHTLQQSSGPTRWHLYCRPLMAGELLLGVVCRLRRTISWRGFADSSGQAPWWLPESTAGRMPSQSAHLPSTLRGQMAEATATADGALHPEDRAAFAESWRAARQQQLPFARKCRIRIANGDYHWHSLVAQPRYSEQGRLLGWLGRSQDQQQLQAVQQQRLEEQRLRRNFLRVASHELNTPLTSLTLNLQLLLHRLGNNPQHAALVNAAQRLAGRALEQAQRLGATVNDLLDVKCLNAGKLQLQLGEVHLAQLLQDTLEFLAPMLIEAGCQAEVDVCPSLLGQWDASRLQQVFFHLFTNVTKYAPQSVLHITAQRCGDEVHISIADDGPGIPKGAQRQIFAMFGRACEVRGTSGLGLGLYLCRHIVHAHGGSLRLKQKGHRGAHFMLQLPLRADQARPGSSRRQGRSTKGAFADVARMQKA